MFVHAQTFAREIKHVFQHLPLVQSLRYAGAISLAAPQILRRRSLAPADEYMNAVTVRKFGRSYQFKDIPFALIREIYLNEIYFLTPEWRPKRGEIVVDLGANRGAFSVLAAGLGAKVYSIEALSEFCEPFRELVELNDVSEQIDHRLGLVCEGYGALSGSRSGSAALQSPSASPLSVSAILEVEGITEVALVKIDIEGAEFLLPQEEPGLLRAAKKIAMEVHPMFGDPCKLVADLRKLGFNSKLLDKWGRSVDSIKTPVGFLYAWRPQSALSSA